MKTNLKTATIAAIFFLLTITTAAANDCAGQNVCQEADGTVQAVVDYLQNDYLKHPGTYQPQRWGILKVEPFDGNYVVPHKYTAQNDYGQTTTTTLIFIIDIYGQVIHAMPPK